MLNEQIKNNRFQEWKLLLKALLINIMSVYAICRGCIYNYTVFFRTHPRNRLEIVASLGDAIMPTIRTIIQPNIVGIAILLALLWWIATVVLVFINLSQNNIMKIMKENRAIPIQAASEPRLIKMVTEMASAAEVPVPQLFMIQNPAPNAFAVGKDPDHAAVAVTSGLVKTLTDDELAAVIGHELAMIRNYSTRLIMIENFVTSAVWNLGVGAVVTIGSWLPNNDVNEEHPPKEKTSAVPAMILLVISGIILLPFVVCGSLMVYGGSKLFNLSLSQEVDFTADAGAVELTHNKQGMIKTLDRFRKIQRAMPEYAPYSRMYFVATTHGSEKSTYQPARNEQPSLLARLRDVEELIIK